MKRVLHTPEGVRDIYNVECGKKLTLEGHLKKVFQLYGYHDIQPPGRILRRRSPGFRQRC